MYDPFQIDVHIHIIIVNIFKIDPAVCLNKTCTNCYIQYTFATLSYTQLKEIEKDKLENKINESDIFSNWWYAKFEHTAKKKI